MTLRSRSGVALVLVAMASQATAQVVLEWDREPQLPGPYRVSMGEAVPDTTGGWYVPASKMQFSFGVGLWVWVDSLLLRYDAAGTLTGSASLAPGTQGGGHPFITDPTGGYWTVVYAGGLALRKFDVGGVQQVSVPIPPSMGTPTALGLAPNGDVFAAGDRSGSPSSAGVGSWTSAGVQNFFDLLPNPNFNGSVGTVSPTGFVALARTGQPNPGQIDVVRPDGSVAWSTATPPTLRVKAMRFTPTGDLVAVGEEGTYPTLGASITKWSPTGALSWSYTSTIPRSSYATVAVAPDGRIATAGTSINFMNGASAALVSRFEADGTHQWTNPWTLSASSSLHRFDRVLFDASGQIVVGGSASLNTTQIQGQLQSAPVIASWSPSGALSWQFVGVSMHNEDICHSLHETSSGSFVYSARGSDLAASFAAPDSGRLLSIRPTSITYCFGDGSGTACPCGNDAAPSSGTGCVNTSGVGGRLVSSGVASLTADTLVLQGSGMPGTASALYFQATTRTNGGAGSAFGDGKLCATGPTMRLGTKFNSAGASQFPAAGDPAIHVQGNVTTPGARMYQVLYRNAAPFCTSAVFNLTNGVEILWTL